MGKQHEEDDRVVADMSGVDSGFYRFELPGRRRRKELEAPAEKRREPFSHLQGTEEMSPSDRRMYVFGAMGASLLIGLVFLTAAFIVILLMVLFW